MPKPRPKIRIGSHRRRDERPGQRHEHRPAGVPDRAQQPRQRHAEREGHVGRQGDPKIGAGDVEGFSPRAEHVQQRAGEGHRHYGHDGADQGRVQQARGGEAAGGGPVAAAERARHECRDGDGEADVDRDRIEQDLRGEADRRLELRSAEPRHIEEGQEVDDEDRQRADRAGAGHDQRVPQDRPFGEFRRLGRLGARGRERRLDGRRHRRGHFARHAGRGPGRLRAGLFILQGQGHARVAGRDLPPPRPSGLRPDRGRRLNEAWRRATLSSCAQCSTSRFRIIRLVRAIVPAPCYPGCGTNESARKLSRGNAPA